MERVICILTAICLALALCACGSRRPAPAQDAAPAMAREQEAAPTAPPAADGEPEVPAPPAEEPPASEETDFPAPQEGWAETYLAFIDDNYDIFAALWPEGVTGIGFIDLDLDGTPELVIFDPGASATMGVQLFDMADGQVFCVSSTQDSAAGAFGGQYYSDVSVSASYFESFRLSRTADGWCFWTDSANGTMEESWESIVRFGSRDGVLTLTEACARDTVIDAETGLISAQSWTVDGAPADEAAYEAAAAYYTEAEDAGYEARGVFLWNDMARYDTTYDGMMTMALDAVEAYVPAGR